MKKFELALLILVIFTITCNSQNMKEQDNLTNIKPIVAGQFYPGTKAQLRNNLVELFEKALPKQSDNEVLAIISPHAGYVFSGSVAASAFNQIDTNKVYKNIFVLAPSHHTSFDGASIYNIGNYETPLGEVTVNIDLANKLISGNKIFTFNKNAHLQEHSLEVQLPFLQHKLKNPINLIPIIFGTHSESTCKKIADALLPYFNEENLFVISSDFSHYPDYETAVEADKLSAEAITSKSVKTLLNILEKNDQHYVNGLQTSMCGQSPIMTLMFMVSATQNLEFKQIQYKNSGDSPYGDHDRVVGYWAITVERKNGQKSSLFTLNDYEKKTLLEIARNTIYEYINYKNMPKVSEKVITPKISIPCGAFVTLHKNNNLRGCIGRFDASEPLYKVIQEMAISSALHDSRFSPVKSKEIDDLEIEISVLTPMRKIESIDEIELGKHGIYIKKGYNSGTFLPQVATETGWTKEEFLGQCASQKAGIGFDGWKNAEIYIYEAIIFSEKEFDK